jgi:hypothetical protein
MRYNDHGLTIRVNFMVNVCVCVCVRFGFNGFVTKVQPFSMVGYYRMDIISDVGHLRPDSVMPLVLCVVAVQWLWHRHCTIGFLG